jgi:heme exporter protein D
VTALALALIVIVALVPQSVAPARSLSIRERAQRSAQLRLRNPDAAGKSRPRAPGCGTF